MQAAKKINLSVLQVVLTWLLLLALPASSLATYSLTPQASAPEQRVTSAETRIGQILVLDANCTGVDGVLILISTRVADDVGWKTATDRPEGRFWNADSYEGNGADPQSLHKYLYANSDPANSSDPGGNMSLSQLSITQAISLSFGAIGSVRGAYGAWRHGESVLWGAFSGFATGYISTYLMLRWPATAFAILPIGVSMGVREIISNIGAGKWDLVGIDIGMIVSGPKLFNYVKSLRSAGTPPPSPPAAPPSPPLKRIHSDETYQLDPEAAASLAHWRTKSTAEIVQSLKIGADDALSTWKDGRMSDGNTRTKVLEERGYDINSLAREIWESNAVTFIFEHIGNEIPK